MRRDIIIDTDPGQDDAVAILLALASPELNVLGPMCQFLPAVIAPWAAVWSRQNMSMAPADWTGRSCRTLL